MSPYDALKYYFEPNVYMARRHRKAAKKRRVRKKWLSRFGPDTNWMQEMTAGKSFLDLLRKSSAGDVEFNGGMFQIPSRDGGP